MLKYDYKYKNRTKLLIKKFKLYIKQGCPNCLKCTKKTECKQTKVVKTKKEK